MSDPETTPPEPRATRRDVRMVGGFFVLSGAALAYFGQNWLLSGVIPMPWVGAVVVVIGGAFLAVPGRFRNRVERLNRIGDAFSRKRPPD